MPAHLPTIGYTARDSRVIMPRFKNSYLTSAHLFLCNDETSSRVKVGTDFDWCQATAG